jgi:hypothetical protein
VSRVTQHRQPTAHEMIGQILGEWGTERNAVVERSSDRSARRSSSIVTELRTSSPSSKPRSRSQPVRLASYHAKVIWRAPGDVSPCGPGT